MSALLANKVKMNVLFVILTLKIIVIFVIKCWGVLFLQKWWLDFIISYASDIEF